MQIILLLLSTFLLGRYTTAREVWIDPHEMDVDLDAIYTKKETKRNQKDDNIGSQYCNKDDLSNSLIYLQRTINLLLNNAIMERDSTLYSGKVNLNIEEEDYIFLTEFANSQQVVNSVSLQKLDRILTKSLMKSGIHKFGDMFAEMGDQMYYAVFNKFTAASLTVVMVMIFIYRLLKSNFSVWFIFKCLLLLAYVIDFATTYLHLIEAEEIKNIVDIKTSGSMPPECDPKKMSWTNYFGYLFKTENPCLQYYAATHKNLYYLITPMKVFSHQFGVLVVGPITALGTALGAFSRQLLDQLPWGINLILFPILLIFVVFIVMILLASLLKCSIKCNLLPFPSLEFGRAQIKQREADAISGNNLTNLLHTHRKFVEAVQQKPSIKSKESQDRKSKPKKLTLPVVAKKKLPDYTKLSLKPAKNVIKQRNDSTEESDSEVCENEAGPSKVVGCDSGIDIKHVNGCGNNSQEKSSSKEEVTKANDGLNEKNDSKKTV